MSELTSSAQDPAASGSSSNSATARPVVWEPYENTRFKRFKHFVSARHALLKPLSRRYFPLAILNPLGVTLGEVIALVVIIGALAPVGYIQRNAVNGSGNVASILLLVLFFFVLHRGPVSWFLAMPFERAIRWHFIFAVLSLLYGLYHGGVAMADEDWNWGHAFSDYGFNTYIAGTILMGLMLLVVVTSLRFVRHLLYQWWVRSHIVISLITVVFAVIHGAAAVIAGLAFLAIDRVYGQIYEARVKRRALAKSAKVHQLPADVVRVSFSRDSFRFKGGQYVNLYIPKVSRFEWHPFSISSGPADETVTIHIRALGNWSRKLHEVAGVTRDMQVYIEGPLGMPSVDVEGDTYKVFALISGGIGVTPLQSVYRELVEQAARGREIKKVLFIWSVRDRFLIDSVYDRSFARKLPSELPTSFQPDNITDAVAKYGSGDSIENEGGTIDVVTVDLEGGVEHGANRRAGEQLSDLFDLKFHLTNPRPEEEFADANVNINGVNDLEFGRARFLEALEKLRDHAIANEEKKVAVLTCGPDSLTRDVRIAAKTASKDGVRFDVHIEHFKW